MKDLERAHAKGEEGAKRAADRAGNQWQADALDLVREFALDHQGELVLAETIRKYVEQDRGLAPPPDARAWGHVMKKAAKLEILSNVGFAPAITSNGGPKVLWRVNS